MLLPVVVRSLSFLIFMFPMLASAAGFTTPVRQGVDIYNAVGGNARLIGFIKIGASEKESRYLAYLSARINSRPLTRAFLAGSLIYFKGLDQPLKVVDLKRRLFSFNGKRIDLNDKSSIEARLSSLEKIVYPRRSAYILWDWIFPYAFAATDDPEKLATLTGIAATAGLTSSAQCLSDDENKNCVNEFMGTLAAVGAVGGLRGGDPASRVFCSPDFRGGQKFVVAGETRNLLAISESNGEYDIRPAHLSSGSPSSNKAAEALLASCRSTGTLANMNIALAYPSATSGTADPRTARQPAARVAVRPAAVSTRAPASTSSTDSFIEREQGGTAR